MTPVASVLSDDLLFQDHVAPFLDLRLDDVLLVDRARTALRLLTTSSRLRDLHALVLFYMDREAQQRTGISNEFASGMARHFPCTGCPYSEGSKTYVTTLPRVAVCALSATRYDWASYERFMACYDVDCVCTVLDSGAVDIRMGVSSYNWVMTFYSSISPRYPTTFAVVLPILRSFEYDLGPAVFPVVGSGEPVALSKRSQARVVYGTSEVQQLDFLRRISRGPLLELYVMAVLDPDALGVMHLVFSDVYVPTNDDDMDEFGVFIQSFISATPSPVLHLAASTNRLAPTYTKVSSGSSVVSNYDTCVSLRMVLSDWFRPRLYHIMLIVFNLYRLYAPCFASFWPPVVMEGIFDSDQALLDLVEFMGHLLASHEYLLCHLVRDRTSVRTRLDSATTQTVVMPTVAYLLQLVGMVFPQALAPTHLALTLPSHVTPCFFPGYYSQYHQFSFFTTDETNIRDLGFPPCDRAYPFSHLDETATVRGAMVMGMSQRVQLHGDIASIRHAKFVSDRFYYEVSLDSKSYKWTKLPEIRRKRPLELV